MGDNIFSAMSALAARHQAINLGQGFPDFACDAALTDAVTQAMRAGHNQYAPMPGVPALRQAIAAQLQALYGHAYSAESEITITAGATQAIFTAILCCTQPGDEVIVLEPCYDFDRLAAAITPRTRALIINTPHNPTGTVWSAADMQRLQEILAPTRIALISDEVYAHMVYAPLRHESAARLPGLASRAFVIGSFGKTFHVTGWKVGYVAAPAALTAELRRLHQFNVFCVNTPMQHGIAAYMQNPAPWQQLPAFYAAKRDRFRAGLAQTRFRLLPCEGAYFQCADISELHVPERDLPEATFCEWLTREIGVAAIPLSAFYADGLDQKFIRFCFAKKDETLQAALQRLARL